MLGIATAGPIGPQGTVGTLANPKRVARHEITKPSVYENYCVDAEGAGGNIVKITADGVTLHHCEIRNATGNGLGYGKGVGQRITSAGAGNCPGKKTLANTRRRRWRHC
jgi:hypothetical protein